MSTPLKPLDNEGRDPASAPAMPFWNMQPDAGGRSTIVQQALAGFALDSVSGDAAPIWMREFQGEVKAVWFNIMPVGWVGEAHPTPALQWVVPLSGRWYIETQDGTRIEWARARSTGAPTWPAMARTPRRRTAPASSATCPACR
jgi:hypothetical protein